MANDSIKKTFGVAALLCVVCAVVVSSAAVILRPTQEANKLLDLKTNILASAGLLKAGVDVETQFEQITTRMVDMETGRFTDAVDAATYDQRKASKDPALSIALVRDRYRQDQASRQLRHCLYSRRRAGHRKNHSAD